MEYQRLGTTGLRVSRIGFGCAAFSGHDYGTFDESEAISAIHTALDCGVNLFDVADVYGFGRAEELLSRALGPRRREVVLATKGGVRWDESGRTCRDGGRDWLKKAVDNSLRRLGVDCIDLFQLHWVDPQTPLAESLAALRRCQEIGKVRYLGICNLDVAILQQAIEITGLDSVQVAYNLLCRDLELEFLGWAAERRLSVLAHSALARGFLSGKYGAKQDFVGTDTRGSSRYFAADGWSNRQDLLDELKSVAWRLGVSPATLAIRWILDDPRVCSALIGVKSPTQLEEAVRATEWSLTSLDRDRLTVASSRCEGVMSGNLARR